MFITTRGKTSPKDYLVLLCFSGMSEHSGFFSVTLTRLFWWSVQMQYQFLKHAQAKT